MRYAIIRGYRMAGPLHDYDFAEFSHETARRIVTKKPIFHRSIHPKEDLVSLCEEKALAEEICSALRGAKELYLQRVHAADAEYEEGVDSLIAGARAECAAQTAQVEEQMAANEGQPKRPSPKMLRAREFQPRLIPGGKA